MRKVSGVPYVEHLLGVTSIVLEFGGDEDEAIAALLHDAIEDQGGEEARGEIRRRFGERVTEIVDGCSDTDVVPKPPWRARKEAYIAHIVDAPPSVLLVSAADKLDNLRSLTFDVRRLGAELWAHFAGRRDGTIWYYRSLVEVFRSRTGRERFGELVDELERAIDELESLAHE